MHNLTLAQQLQALAAGEFSSVELTQHYINRIENHQSSLNAFVSFTPERALAEARQADQRTADKPLLNGIPLALKDIF